MLITAAEIIKQSWGLYVKNFKKLLPYIAILLIPNLALTSVGLASLFLDEYAKSGALATANNLIVLTIFVAGVIFSIWTNAALIKNLRELMLNNPPIKIKDALRRSSHLIFPIVFTTLLAGILVLLGLVALVIPGVIISIWCAFVYYIVIFEEKTGWTAVKQSREMVRGRWWAILGKILGPGLFYGIIFLLASNLLTGLVKMVINSSADQVWANGIISVITNAVFAPLTILPAIILYFSVKENPAATAPINPPSSTNN